MKFHVLVLALLCSAAVAYAQKIKAPKTIEHAIEILKTDCPDDLQQIIKKTPEDSLIYLTSPWGGDYKTISNWTTGLSVKRKTKLEKYYAPFGITYPKHIETIVLISFKTTLNDETFNHEFIMKPFREIERKWDEEDKVRFTSDSLNGVYIPKNLEDCFKEIDSFWDDSTKTQIKTWTEDEFTAKAHFGFGMWMRNNWKLWAGSRLSKYFHELGIHHPDDMSGIILRSYHRKLTGREIKLEEQVKYYQDYWKKAQN